MAKKSEENVIDTPPTPEELADRLYASVEKDYGEGVLVSGEEATDGETVTIPWTPSIDLVLSGGIEEGSFVNVVGPPKTGKSVGAMCFAANAQRPEYGSRPVYYAKVEGRLSKKHVKGIKGLDRRKGRFNIIQSSKDKLLTGQDFLTILENVIKTVPKAVVIIDSISALSEEKEQNNGLGTETRGGMMKTFSQFCRLINQAVPVNGSIIIGITQLVTNTSGYGAHMLEKSGQAWKYQKDYDLMVKKGPFMTVGGKVVDGKTVGGQIIGLEADWTCQTSKNGMPGLTSTGFLRFGVGFDRLYEMLHYAAQWGLVKKAGSWLTLSFLGKPEHKHLLDNPDKIPQFQGAEKLYKAMEENDEWAAALAKEFDAVVSGPKGEEE